MDNRKDRRNGIVLSYLLLVLDTIVSIIYTPILLNRLGDSQYGLYQLIGSLVNYFAVMDLGLGGTITRYLVKYNTEKDEKGKSNFFAMALIGYSAIGVFIILIGTGLLFSIGSVFKSLSNAEVRQAKIMFALLLFNLVITLFDHAFSGALQAYEKFTYDKGLRILRVVLRTFLVIALLQFVPNAIIIVAVDFVLTTAILIIKIVLCTHSLKITPKFYGWDNALFREVLGFTLAIFLQSIINQFNNNVDKTVLGIKSTTVAVAVYSVAMQIFSAFEGISTAVQSVYLPKISKGVFSGKSDREITLSLVKPSRLQYVLLAGVCGGFWIYGYQFICLWCGKSKTDAWLIACIVMTSSLVQLFQNTTTCVLKAKNLLRGRTIINLFTAMGNFIITILLVPKYGMLGAAAGTAFAMVFGYIICNNIYYKVRVGIDVGLYFKETLKGLLPASLLGIAVGIVPYFLIPSVSWLFFGIKLMLFCALYFSIVFFFGFNKEEKNILLNFLHKKILKNKS